MIRKNEVTGGVGKAILGPVQQSLEGVGQYADEGLVIVYHDAYNGVSVHRKEDVVIDWSREPVRTGWRSPTDKLWHWELKAPLPEEINEWVQRHSPRVQPEDIDQLPQGTKVLANNVYELPSIKAAVRFMHAVCGYPVKSTWLKAIRNNHYVGWPMLTVRNVEKHFPETVETPRGHLNKIPGGIRSTKPAPLPEPNEADLKKAFNKKERDVFINVWDIKDAVYSDQPGKFPVRSVAGYNYQMIMIHIDSNTTHAEPMKNRSAAWRS